MGNPNTCTCCGGSKIAGVHLPANFDDREESRDGKVFVTACNACDAFANDADAAGRVAEVTGWAVMKSYDREDELDPKGRAAKQGTDYYRPYFTVTLTEAEKLMEARNKEAAQGHKGLVCPGCGFDGKDASKIANTTYQAFVYVEGIRIWRRVMGFNDKGELAIETDYHTGEGFDEGTDPRIMCGACLHEFPIPADVLAKIDWV